jgi:hypothetical protein
MFELCLAWSAVRTILSQQDIRNGMVRLETRWQRTVDRTPYQLLGEAVAQRLSQHHEQ